MWFGAIAYSRYRPLWGLYLCLVTSLGSSGLGSTYYRGRCCLTNSRVHPSFLFLKDLNYVKSNHGVQRSTPA